MKRKLFARIFRKGCDDNESWNRWVRVTESKQIMEVQFVFNTSTNLWWKSELKVITQQDQLKCSQRDWNCKAKFVHTSKLAKSSKLAPKQMCVIFAQELCFLFLRFISWGLFQNRQFWNFSVMHLLKNLFLCFNWEKRRLDLQVIFLPHTFHESREKQPAESQIKSKKIVAHLGFRTPFRNFEKGQVLRSSSYGSCQKFRKS